MRHARRDCGLRQDRRQRRRVVRRAGHEVLFSFSRDPEKLRALADAAGNGARAGTPAEAVAFGEVVMLSVPWAMVDEALDAAGPLDGKPLIDTTNQFGPGGVVAIPGGLSAAEFNAGRASGGDSSSPTTR